MSFPSIWPDRPLSAALTFCRTKLGKQWSARSPAHGDEECTGAGQIRCTAGCESIKIIAVVRWQKVADRLSMMPPPGELAARLRKAAGARQ